MEGQKEGRKEGEKEGRKEGRGEWRKERKKGEKEGRKEGANFRTIVRNSNVCCQVVWWNTKSKQVQSSVWRSAFLPFFLPYVQFYTSPAIEQDFPHHLFPPCGTALRHLPSDVVANPANELNSNRHIPGFSKSPTKKKKPYINQATLIPTKTSSCM